MNTNIFHNCGKCFDNLSILFSFIKGSNKINLVVSCKKCKCIWFKGIVNPDDFEFEKGEI